MSRTDKDRPWRVKHKDVWGVEWTPPIGRPRFRYNGYNDNWLSKTVKDFGSERSSMRDYTLHLKKTYNSVLEVDEEKREPQTRTEYVH
jgi:hypothetical protein